MSRAVENGMRWGKNMVRWGKNGMRWGKTGCAVEKQGALGKNGVRWGKNEMRCEKTGCAWKNGVYYMCVNCGPRLACAVRTGISGTTLSAFVELFDYRRSLLNKKLVNQRLFWYFLRTCIKPFHRA
ncbi:hypothetical protein DPMN_183637 [Dreissena polymorpha]|uniref:Uncharacterized protein n=1 Tax=Dreissena polymorpha TaxID=45954 RepID=A0A9D4DHY3_DREPO|nr:hypothetical protein DPMN_183637 [Dreissena polymorpha]